MSSLTPAPAQTDREVSHFSAPVRSGRRRRDEVGRLEMTNLRLRFHGAMVIINVPWDVVTAVERVERDLVVLAGDRRRQLRFCFHTVEEANQGALIARSLRSASGPAA